jgi:hypothetical protein
MKNWKWCAYFWPCLAWVLPFCIPLLVWSWLVLEVWSEKEDSKGRYTTQIKYGQNELAPEWMPESWVRSFLREVNLDVSEALFARKLSDIESMLAGSNPSKPKWIKRVVELNRTYQGEVLVSLRVRKPVCLMVNRGRKTYLDEELKEIAPFYRKDMRMLANGEILPLVDVSAIAAGSDAQKAQWLREMVGLLGEWKSSLVIKERFTLSAVIMKPYQAESSGECQLLLNVKDLAYGGVVDLNWGIHREYNELEDRRSEDKWSSLMMAIGQNRKFNALDLRYKRPEIKY